MQSDFDVAAKSYDTDFTDTPIGRAQRNRVYQYLNLLLSNNSLQVLELNCGTGRDASHIAQFGHQITATDISKEMISVASKKHQHSNLHFEVLDINQLDKFETQSLDLIFSNFGGFNCLTPEELQSFFTVAYQRLNSGGKIALVIMPKNTLWEQCYFLLKGAIKKAKRRKNSPVKANVNGVAVETWYYNPKDIQEFAKEFTIQKIKPIGLCVPPSYLNDSFIGSKTMVSFLNFLDSICSFSFLSRYADHFYIQLEKKTK